MNSRIGSAMIATMIAGGCAEDRHAPLSPPGRALAPAMPAHCVAPGPATVTNTLGDGPGSLKAAVTYVNANADPDNPKTIDFCIENDGSNTFDPVTGVFTIPLTSLSNGNGVRNAVVDGTTQPGYADRPLIEIVGPVPPVHSQAFAPVGAGAGVRGLIINRIGRPIFVVNAPNFVVEKNWIGLSRDADSIVGPLSGNVAGIFVIRSDQGRIADNVIAITGGAIVVGDSDELEIRSNRIGVDPTGERFVCQNSTTDCTGEIGTLAGIGVGSGGSGHHIVDNQIVVRSTGIQLGSTGDGHVVENNVIGVDAAMTRMLASDALPGTVSDGIHISTDRTVVRNNVIAVHGRAIQTGPVRPEIQPEDNEIVGNYIGQSPSGVVLQEPGTGFRGIQIEHYHDPAPLDPGGVIRDNVICCQHQGIVLRGNPAFPAVSPRGHRFENNTIEASTQEAIRFQHVAAPNEVVGNALRNNGGAAINLLDISGPITMRANVIDDNGGIGIDLGSDGVTPNDPAAACDADVGSNLRQNFPEIARAGAGAGLTVIQGSLNSAASSAYDLEFFVNGSDAREGERPIAVHGVVTDPDCGADFTVLIGEGLSPGRYVTATATDENGNTSEISAPVTVTELTLTGQIEATFELVERLVDDGELQADAAHGLEGKLRNVVRQLDRGHEDGALESIRAFIRQVEDLRDDGQVSAEGAAALVSAAEAIEALILAP